MTATAHQQISAIVEKYFAFMPALASLLPYETCQNPVFMINKLVDMVSEAEKKQADKQIKEAESTLAHHNSRSIEELGFLFDKSFLITPCYLPSKDVHGFIKVYGYDRRRVPESELLDFHSRYSLPLQDLTLADYNLGQSFGFMMANYSPTNSYIVYLGCKDTQTHALFPVQASASKDDLEAQMLDGFGDPWSNRIWLNRFTFDVIVFQFAGVRKPNMDGLGSNFVSNMVLIAQRGGKAVLTQRVICSSVVLAPVLQNPIVQEQPLKVV